MAYDSGNRSRCDTGDSAFSESSASRHSDAGEQSSSRHSKSNSFSSIREESFNDRRPPRRSSPTRSESSNAAPPSENSEYATINQVSPELLAQLTERIKRDVFEHLKKSGSIDSAVEPPSGVPIPRSSSNKTSLTSSPPPSTRTPSPPQAARRLNTTISPPLSPVRSHPASPAKEKPAVRFKNRGSVGSVGSVDKEGARTARPTTQPYSPVVELSTVDQKWGRLFDDERNPTSRLGQVLRGLANHIIEEFAPKKSIVITPDKMAVFYASHSVDREAYPLSSIFKTQSYELISKLYQDLGCQHHLVQENAGIAPIIPGLTPVGFAHWMTTWILAYPDQESARLAQVVLHTPINACSPTDGKPERLPKQISRYLLPSKEDSEAREALRDAVTGFFEDFDLANRRRASLTSLPPSRRASGTHAQTRPIDIPQSKNTSNYVERERATYSTTPSDAAIVEDAVKIERERKPYTAQPGSGKFHTDNLGVLFTNRPVRANSASRVSRESEPQVFTRHSRTQSTATNNYMPGLRPGGATRRARSPPVQNFSQSTPLNLDIGATSSSSSFSPPKQPQHLSSSSVRGPHLPVGDPLERNRDRDNYEDPRRWDRRGTVDNPRLNEIHSPRDAERYGRMYEPKSADARLDEEYHRSLLTDLSRLPRAAQDSRIYH